ncbi:unnamed protein product [Lampetra planeri]
MCAAALLFVFMCLTAAARADHHQPCHSPNMTGFMSLTSFRGGVRALGDFTYDSMGRKLRFQSNDSLSISELVNKTLSLDLLMLFEEGIFYEIDSKNQSCEKKSLHSSLHPLDIPDDAKSHFPFNLGNPSIEGEGLKVSLWMGSVPEMKVSYSMCVTQGCLPFSTLYFSESDSLIVSIMNVENDIKDPDVLAVPSFCQGLPVEETPEGTVNSFINEFL